MDYIPLHMHGGASYLDGAIKLDEYAKKLIDSKIPGGALTDHGNVVDAYAFYNEFKSNDLTPIIGIEAYFCNNVEEIEFKEKYSHQVILCENLQGFKNLMKLSSTSYLKFKYKKPRLSLDYIKALPQNELSGLVITSACISNHIARFIMDDDMEPAKRLAWEYQKLFGDDFYFEIHSNKIDVQPKVNLGLISIGKELGIKCIVVTDSHYLCHNHAQSHDILLAVQTKANIDDEKRFRFTGDDFFLQDSDYMNHIFLQHGLSQREIDIARKNTWEILEKCSDLKIEYGKHVMPVFDIKKQNDCEEFIRFKKKYGKSSLNIDYLKYKVSQGVREKLGGPKNLTKEYLTRINYELDIIHKFNLTDYFLIVGDYCDWARKNDILIGYGRGSSAGSLVNYLMSITNIDPIKYDLVFERFLNPGRLETGEFPDIDTDFQHNKRYDIIEYLKNKYGEHNVSFIGTETQITSKLAFKDIGRVLGIEFKILNMLSKFIPDDTKEVNFNEIKKLKPYIKKSPALKEAIKHIPFMVGLPRGTGVHPSGVLITPTPIWDYVPVRDMKLDKDTKGVVSQFDMKDCEKAGLIKFDILGIKNLTVIKSVIDKLKEEGIEEDFYNIAFDDVDVYKLLSKGKTVGVFQLETRLNTNITKRFKPKNIEDLALIVSICRPGSLGIVDEFIKIRNGKLRAPEHKYAKLNKILKPTNGFIIYQEQALEIVRQLAGFGYAEADLLRRAIGKKEHDTMAVVRTQFIEKFIDENCTKRSVHGISSEPGEEEKEIKELKKDAEEIFSFIEKAQNYSFNKAHAVSYAILGYLTAYFKLKYPALFYSKLINQYTDRKEKVQDIVNEAMDRGIKIFPPSIETTPIECVAIGKNILLGFNLIKGFGKSILRKLASISGAIEKIDIINFIRKCIEEGVKKNNIVSLIEIGSLDYISSGLNRPQMIDLQNELIASNKIMKTRKEILKKTGKVNPKWQEAKDMYDNPIIREIDDWKLEEKMQKEENNFEFSIQQTALMAKEAEILENTSENGLNELVNGDQVTLVGTVTRVHPYQDRNKKDMAFLTVKTLTSELKFVVFQNEYDKHAEKLKKNSNLLFECVFQRSESFGDSFIVNKVKNWD